MTIRCDHSGRKSVVDHVATKSHQERAKAEDKQPRLFFETAADKSLKEKVIIVHYKYHRFESARD